MVLSRHVWTELKYRSLVHHNSQCIPSYWIHTTTMGKKPDAKPLASGFIKWFMVADAGEIPVNGGWVLSPHGHCSASPHLCSIRPSSTTSSYSSDSIQEPRETWRSDVAALMRGLPTKQELASMLFGLGGHFSKGSVSHAIKPVSPAGNSWSIRIAAWPPQGID